MSPGLPIEHLTKKGQRTHCGQLADCGSHFCREQPLTHLKKDTEAASLTTIGHSIISPKRPAINSFRVGGRRHLGGGAKFYPFRGRGVKNKERFNEGVLSFSEVSEGRGDKIFTEM